MIRNPMSRTRQFIFRCAVVLVLLAVTSLAKAQANTDQEFVRTKGIQSALFIDPHYHGGVFLEYDTLGRLRTATQFNWQSYDLWAGDSYVSTFDTSGRYLSSRSYALSDSTLILHPAGNSHLINSHRTEYRGDSVMIEYDTSWDDFQRIIRIRKNEVHTTWITLPLPPEVRSVYYREKIISSRLEIWSDEEFTYSSIKTLNPETHTKTGGVSMLEGRYTSDRISYHLHWNSYTADSMTQAVIDSWYSLHGDRDTSYSSYQSSRFSLHDNTAHGYNPPVINYGYVQSKKWGSFYRVRFVSPYSAQREKLISREPWTDYRFMHYPPPFLDHYAGGLYDIKDQRKIYHSKPKYTYWRNH